MENKAPFIIGKNIEYSTVQFDLSNATANPITIEIDTNSLTNVESANGVGAFPNTLGQTICGGIMGGLYYNPTTKRLISGGSDATGVTPITQVINVVSGTVETTLPNSIISDRMIYVPSVDRIYSLQNGSGIISIINPSTGVEISTIPSPAVATTFYDFAFSTIENKLYIMDNSADQTIYVLDVFSNTYIGNVVLVGLGFYATIEYAPTTNRVYAANQGAGDRFQIIDSNSDTIVGNVPPFVALAEEMIYNPNTDTIYFNDFTGGNIRILDMATELILLGASNIIPFGGRSTDMTISVDTNTIWAVRIDTNITIIDCNTNTVSGAVGVPAVLWRGQVEYARGINTVYTSPSAVTTCIQQIDANGNQFFIDGSSDFNLFIRDTLINPKEIDRIMVYAQDNSDLLNPLTIGKEDATGLSCSSVKLPNTTVANNQLQDQIGQLDFENFIFDVTAFFSYTILPFTTIKWVIYYKEYERGDLLSGKVMIKEFDVMKPTDPDTYDEKFLQDTALKPSFEKNKFINANIK